MPNKKRRSRSSITKPPAAAAGDAGAREEGDDRAPGPAAPAPAAAALAWAAVPGTRLAVDLADGPAAPAADADAAFDPAAWTSRHYDGDDDREDAKWDADLYDPAAGAGHDPRDAFDAGGPAEGAGDDGMFLSLEVIPGDAYRVERTGDDTSGFVTRVVVDGPAAPAPGDPAGAPPGERKGRQRNRERYKAQRLLKRKRQKEEAREKKRQAGGAGSAAGARGAENADRALATDGGAAAPLQKDGEQAQVEVDPAKVAEGTPGKRQKRAAKTGRVRGEEKAAPVADAVEGTPPKNSKRAKETRGTGDADAGAPAEEEAAAPSDADAVDRLATAWAVAAPGLSLHPTLAAGLHGLGYAGPTPVQRASLPAAVLGRRDIVGAAPTGSGKTLSYGLPVLQSLLEGADAAAAGAEAEAGTPGTGPAAPPLQALVLVPTRELALQVTAELEKVCLNAVKIGTIVGGFAEVKQRRTLEKTRPPVIVGTPGRLWELMSSNEYSHLNDLSQLRFLVIDEADRMIKQGSFPQLQQIFNAINTANPPPEDPDDMADESDDDDDDEDRMRGLRGVRGEARVVMLDDSILERIERQRNGEGATGGGAPPTPIDVEDDEYEEQRRLLDEESGTEDEEEAETVAAVHRQTFMYSATLTLPPSMHRLIKKDITKQSLKRRRKSRQPTTVDGAIAEILEVAGAMGKTKIIDLSKVVPEGKKGKPSKEDRTKKNSKNGAEATEPAALGARLPPGLTLGEIRCAQRHKDSHLYAYLVTTRQGSSGPCLVFCNSIAAVRRVGDTLKMLGLPVKVLHAQMQQKSRLGALESLQKSNSRAVVVASDVAARGLDIASVTTIIHYDVARVVDTFIHRAGRTARGVGDKAVGTSISLVAPAEEKEHQKIVEAVRGGGTKSLEEVHIDGRLMNEATTRVALATKIVSCNDTETQATRRNKWLEDAAKDCDLNVDEDMLEGSLLDGDQRERHRFLEAKRAKTELRQLLAKPMRKQHFGKFLSGAGLRESIKSEVEVKPFVVKPSLKKGKARRKKVTTKK